MRTKDKRSNKEVINSVHKFQHKIVDILSAGHCMLYAHVIIQN